MIRKINVRFPIILSTIAALLWMAPAQALVIKLNDVVEGGSDPVALHAFKQAAKIWESVLHDKVTVRLDVGFSTLDPGVLGQTGSQTEGIFYSDVRDAMAQDITSFNDVGAVNSLSGGETFNFIMQDLDDLSQAILFDETAPQFGLNSVLDVNRANAKALGLLVDDGTTSDGSIQFSDRFNFDFDASDGIDADAFDFVGVAIHEIGHALGFVSGVDILDLVSVNGPFGDFFSTADLLNFRVFSPLDLFKYSEVSKSVNANDFTFNAFGSVFFSPDGATNTGIFETGSFNGSGNQASHWLDTPQNIQSLGIMDPTAGRGEFLQFTGLDLQAFDVMGWDLVSVPEPSTLGLLGLGLLGLVIARRRRSTNV